MLYRQRRSGGLLRREIEQTAIEGMRTGRTQEARLVARTALLFMQLSRPSFCESYERRIFETTGGQQRPRFGFLALMVTV